MYFNIFIVMYLTRSLSNAILFEFPPLDEDSLLTNLASKRSKMLFKHNTYNDKGMDLESFKYLWTLFEPIHKLQDRDIENLFIEVVNNRDGLMTLNKFLTQTLNVVQTIESKLKTIYTNYQYQDNKMSKKKFFEAIREIGLDIPENIANEIITEERDFDFLEFRYMFAKLYHQSLRINNMTNRTIIFVEPLMEV
ncbi:uncharacterized protein LOC126896883 [Daktulosphaira vitifoliae]|uniref:uncharacterized protein LOC126896883 n=1 Tax=Daktulosphaira vitifoliae TaxID=58002 RepID=UPI0021AA0329|nr:uncharacterized protein LOC126896883 [Daktulosphaira vitifoliae]XP_050526001.1 uncharacterized protein LOC126896883 [Daktulosphaira vitifoliae]